MGQFNMSYLKKVNYKVYFNNKISFNNNNT